MSDSRRERTEEAKLGYFTYKVHFRSLSGENHGETSTELKEIWINNNDPLQVQRETLFHELLHVSLEDCPSLRIDEMKADEREEDIVRCISPRMMQYLDENEWLLDFFFEYGE